MVTPQRQHDRVPDGAVAHQRDVRRATADVDHDHAELFLVVEQHRLGRGEGLEHNVLDGEARAIDRAHHVLDRGDGAGHDVHLDLEAHARHADRLAHAVAVVDDEALRQHVDDLAVLRQIDRARGLDHALDVGVAHLVVLAGDPHDTAAVHAADMAPRDPREGARDLDPGHLLGLADGSPDRLDRRVDVDDDPAPEPARGCAADADDVQAAPGRGLGDDRANLRGADVQADDEIGCLRALHRMLLRWKTTWSRNRRSTVRTSCVAICARTPSRRARRSSQSSVPRRTSTPSTV